MTAALHWDGSRLHVLDRTRLPAREEVLVLTGVEDTARAIERPVVRGAPLIGVAAAYGLAMGVAAAPSRTAVDAEDVAASAAIGERAADLLAAVGVPDGRLRLMTHCNSGALARVAAAPASASSPRPPTGGRSR